MYTYKDIQETETYIEMSPNNIHTYIYTYSAPIVKIDEDIARISQIKPKLGDGPKLNRVFVWTMSKTEL